MTINSAFTDDAGHSLSLSRNYVTKTVTITVVDRLGTNEMVEGSATITVPLADLVALLRTQGLGPNLSILDRLVL